MSDKSFGDNTNRNVVKNPLLLSAVTGLSIEDLTHNAVLLPAAPTQTLVTRQDPTRPQARTLAHPTNDPPNVPFGDANLNPLPSNTQADHFSNVLDTEFHIQGAKTADIASTTQSKATVGSEDEFDVNEYFARLQGTRYVSAPYSHKEDQNANLDAAEDNLEEINLNEPEKGQVEYQHSLTADIAQNFSQLPTVLPQVASAVFSSFSNMIYKSREQTPDERGPGPRADERRVEETTVPLVGVEEKREVAPPPRQPPKEPPIGGTANYRITTKKKAYAQIPGLSTGDNSNMTIGQTQTQAVPSFFIPTQDATDNRTETQDTARNEAYNIFNPGDNQPKVFTAVKESDTRSPETPQDSNTFVSSQPTAPIIPPPPMFSNLPKRESQGSVEKTILPPSVARRISAKPQVSTAYPSNILIPTMPDTSTKMFDPMSVENSQSLPPTAPLPTFAPSQASFSTNVETSVFTPFGGQTTDSSLSASNMTFYPPQIATPSNKASIGPLSITPTLQSNIDLSRAPGTSTFVPTATQKVPPTATKQIFEPSLSQVDITQPYMAVCSAKTVAEPSTFISVSTDTAAQSVPMFNPMASQTVAPAKIMEPPFHPQRREETGNIPMFGPSQTDVKPAISANLPPPMSNVRPNLFGQNTSAFKPQIPANDQSFMDEITEAPIEPPKPIREPPKMSGGLNYRMNKKRPQYYAGPIEGVGSISNNVKPIMPPVKTPLKPCQDMPVRYSSVEEQVTTPFDVNAIVAAPAYNIQPPEFETAFDLSRPTTEMFENYEQPKPEPKGFDIFGSLKSKLSSIAVNKIQSKVTTFFDPTFNDKKKNVDGDRDNVSYQPVNTSYDYSQGQSSFEIFVPNVEVHQPPPQSSSYQAPQSDYNYGQNAGKPYNYYQIQSQKVIPGTTFCGNPHMESAFNIPKTSEAPAISLGAESREVTNESALDEKYLGGIRKVETNSEAATFPTNKTVSDSGYSEPEALIAPPNRRYDDVDMTTLDKIVKDVADFCIGSPKENVEDFAQNTDKTLQVGDDCFKNTAEHAPKPIGSKGERHFDLSAKNFFDDPATKLFSHDLKSEGFETSIFTPKPGEITSSFGKTEVLQSLGDGKDIGFMRTNKESAFLPEISDIPSEMMSLDNPSLKPDVFTDFKFKIKETNLLESLSKDVIPIVAVSSVPLFGLSTLIADCSEEMPELTNEMANVPLFEPQDTLFHQNANVSFFENVITTSATDRQDEQISEQNMCDTCNEANNPDSDADNDTKWTAQLIENITSPIQLSNAVEATLTETNPGMDREDFNPTQCDEITKISEDTVNIINVQSATALLESGSDLVSPRTFGWAKEETAYAASEHDYTYQLNSNSLGLFGTNPLYFEDIPNYPNNENKANYKASQEKLSTNQSLAPPVQEDSNVDETGLDVLSIEQDAKKDFPIFEEYVIEPSETADKTEYKERERTSESSMPDTFTNRIERFKKMEETTVDAAEEFPESHKGFHFDMPPKYNPAISIASYFDTGNYAVETHYRNSISSPTGFAGYSVGSPNMPMRIPPGFEDEFHRRLSGMASQDTAPSSDVPDVTTIPETSTQTNITTTTTFTSPTLTTEVSREFPSHSGSQETAETAKAFETKHLPVFANIFGGDKTAKEDNVEDLTNVAKILPPIEPVSTQSLPDPLNFFASNDSVPPSDSNRLASYFSMPPPKPDHSKSFFELSQSQNHYKHESVTTNTFNIPQDNYIANLNLMKDLTSIDNFEVTEEQVVRTINYFTVKYDMTEELNMSAQTDQRSDKNGTENDIGDDVVEKTFNKCIYCCNMVQQRRVTFGSYNVKAYSDHPDTSREQNNMEASKESAKKTVTVNFENFPLDDDSNDGVTVITENRPIVEYVPVEHHWFYRVDVEEKSIWRGFSVADSTALEEAFLSPELTEDTMVATDGGRYDVNVQGRVRIPVYWKDKPTNVRRCSWFYKGTTDARFVPYREEVADLLEEEYRHGVTSGTWHRRLVLPERELVVMHGPSVMVHFLHSGADDAFTSPSLFAFGKRVYRNPPKIRVSRDLCRQMDHLILLVHGAGEYRVQKEKIQSSSRPRVVRRGCDESEIEDPSPSSIDHLLLLCHGVGSACDMRFRSVEEVVEDFRATSLQLLQSHYRNSYDTGVVSRVEVLPISWHATLHSGETGVDRRLAQLTLDSIPRLRNFTNDTVLDVLFYTSPVFCQTIIETVCNEINRIYSLFKQRNPHFTGGVSLGGHSLGSVILYDLLCHQQPEKCHPSPQSNKTYVSGTAGTGHPCVQYPKLAFSPAALYALGSPIAIFECIRGVESLGKDFALPTCKNFFNIFHPYDPIAYRIEPLINPQLRDVKPHLIPHHKGRKRMHLELKDTMARVGADLKQKLLESLKVTWNKWKSQPPTPPPDGHLEKVDEDMEKEALCQETKDDLGQDDTATPEMLGKLNSGRRVDYVLQEAPLEMINEYLFAMSSHVGYWESEDTMLLMLREIYDALGVQPDSTIPQQTLTVQRTRAAKDDKIYIGVPDDNPSTSQGGT